MPNKPKAGKIAYDSYARRYREYENGVHIQQYGITASILRAVGGLLFTYAGVGYVFWRFRKALTDIRSERGRKGYFYIAGTRLNSRFFSRPDEVHHDGISSNKGFNSGHNFAGYLKEMAVDMLAAVWRVIPDSFVAFSQTRFAGFDERNNYSHLVDDRDEYRAFKHVQIHPVIEKIRGVLELPFSVAFAVAFSLLWVALALPYSAVTNLIHDFTCHWHKERFGRFTRIFLKTLFAFAAVVSALAIVEGIVSGGVLFPFAAVAVSAFVSAYLLPVAIVAGIAAASVGIKAADEFVFQLNTNFRTTLSVLLLAVLMTSIVLIPGPQSVAAITFLGMKGVVGAIGPYATGAALFFTPFFVAEAGYRLKTWFAWSKAGAQVNGGGVLGFLNWLKQSVASMWHGLPVHDPRDAQLMEILESLPEERESLYPSSRSVSWMGPSRIYSRVSSLPPTRRGSLAMLTPACDYRFSETQQPTHQGPAFYTRLWKKLQSTAQLESDVPTVSSVSTASSEKPDEESMVGNHLQ